MDIERTTAFISEARNHDMAQELPSFVPVALAPLLSHSDPGHECKRHR